MSTMEKPKLPSSKPPSLPKEAPPAAPAQQQEVDPDENMFGTSPDEDASAAASSSAPPPQAPQAPQAPSQSATAVTPEPSVEQRKGTGGSARENHPGDDAAGGVMGAASTVPRDFENSCKECLPLLLHKTELAFQAAKEAHAFFKKRVDAENNYAKSLAQVYKETATLSMVKKMTKDLTLADKEIGPSLRRGWCAVEEQTQFECRGRLDFAAKLQQEVVDPLGAWIKETEPHRKKLQTDGQRRCKELADANATLAKLKDALDRADGTVTTPQVVKSTSFKDRMASMVAKKVPTSRDQIEAEYHIAVAAAGESRLRYNAEVPGILRELNRLETARMDILQHSLKEFLDLQVVSFMGFQENWPTVHSVVSEADPAADIAEFIAAMAVGGDATDLDTGAGEEDAAAAAQ